MARPIRFPLTMKDGEQVRTLDELREHFDLESVLGYFADGKLEKWLADRYYEDKAEAVSALSADMPNLNEKLCAILEVEYTAEEDSTDLDAIRRRNEKLRILQNFTADPEILNSVDLVAMDQEELFDILDTSPEKVYLFRGDFSIPFGKKNICYIGLDQPTVKLEKGKPYSEYIKAGIAFINVTYAEGINPYFTEAEQLFLDGKYADAFPLLKKTANYGNPRSIYFLALFYSNGYNVATINKVERNRLIEKAISYHEAFSTYGYAIWRVNNKDERSALISDVIDEISSEAECGCAEAQTILGLIFEKGKGVVQDYTKAIELYRKAAEQGYPRALFNLGRMYEKGNGIEQDYEIAIEMYQKAANQGYARAQNQLGSMYEDGIGVEQDEIKAFEWYHRAAEQGLELAQFNLGYLYNNGESISQNVSKAIEWYRKAAEQGYGPAQFTLGLQFEQGTGVAQDYAQAIEWYFKAAEQGFAIAQRHLGDMYYNGLGVDEDNSIAIDWYRKAAEQGDVDAQSSLGSVLFFNGYEDEGGKWLREAAQQGDEAAKELLVLFF